MAKKNPVANELFWEARQRLNLSRSQLADDANQEPIMRTCKHVPLNENTIGRIEQGRIGGGMCDARKAALCARLEVADPVDIGLVAERRLPTRLAPTRPRHRSARIPVAVVVGDGLQGDIPWRPPEEFSGVLDLAAGTGVVPRDPAQARAKHQTLRLALAALAAALGITGSDEGGRRRHIGVADVDNLTAITSLYRNADRHAGGGVFVSDIDRVARSAADVLSHEVSSKIEGALFDALAEIRYLAGWTAFDAMHFNLASRHFAAAERFASDGGDAQLLAYVRYGQAKLLQHQRDNREALQVLSLSRRRLDKTPALIATLRGTEAASFAALGNFDAARRALEDATEAHAAIVPGNEPHRLAFRNVGEVYAQYSRVYRDWARRDPDRAPDAVRWTSAALTEFGPANVRSAVLNRVGLVASYFLADDVDRALAEGAQVVRDASMISSPRVIDRIANLRRDADKHRGNSAVDDFLAGLPRSAEVSP